MVSWKAMYELVGPEAPHIGLGLIVQPLETHIEDLNFTLPMGKGTSLYYSLVFQLPKWDWNVWKVDEWIDVSPAHTQLYQVTTQQKQTLESTIKQGLTSAAQAVADLELLKHDLRKYREIMDYIEAKDEHSLKSIFVDQVDFNAGGTGQGAGRLSMSFMQQANILPAIVSHFYMMESLDDLEKHEYLSTLPRVEKLMLKTKRINYEEWKKLFCREVRERYQNLLALIRSRRMSIDQYREWLKPYIAKHKLLNEGMSRPDVRAKMLESRLRYSGQVISYNRIELLSWYHLIIKEVTSRAGELEINAPALDDFVKRNFIFDLAADFPKKTQEKLRADGEKSLKEQFPWITEEWVEKTYTSLLGTRNKIGVLEANWYPYYTVFPITYDRIVFRTPDGREMEDITFDIRGQVWSKNLVLVKLLEIKAKQEEFERYVNKLIGLEKETINYRKEGKKFVTDNGKEFNSLEEMTEEYPKEFYVLSEMPVEPRRNLLGPVRDFFDFFGIKFFFKKGGPYERDFYERVPNFHCMFCGARYNQLINFLQKKAAVGE
ncbi:MAG: hypothetical protein B6U68_02165 [Candidatus Aenigmarchaeota archaeon ex4484_14]|nr:MAG: hypothetical protein B6U68_02165 [Candidatus Aenigmarchaeota archaeon ex4484_14]